MKLETDFLDESLQKTVTPKLFTCHHMKTLLVEFNTLIPLSAIVEHLFSLGKDDLHPKRAGLSDAHFLFSNACIFERKSIIFLLITIFDSM